MFQMIILLLPRTLLLYDHSLVNLLYCLCDLRTWCLWIITKKNFFLMQEVLSHVAVIYLILILSLFLSKRTLIPWAIYNVSYFLKGNWSFWSPTEKWSVSIFFLRSKSTLRGNSWNWLSLPCYNWDWSVRSLFTKWVGHRIIVIIVPS